MRSFLWNLEFQWIGTQSASFFQLINISKFKHLRPNISDGQTEETCDRRTQNLKLPYQKSANANLKWWKLKKKKNWIEKKAVKLKKIN